MDLCHHHMQQVIGNRRNDKRGDLGAIVTRRNFHHIHAENIDTRKWRLME